MANKPLKTIKFPGLDDTYTVPQVDAALATSGAAADAKKVGDELSDLKQDLEGLDVYTLGLYPQMSVADTAVASFADGADNIPVKALTVDVTPVQNLHGQANPYPDGGGKNLLPMTVAGIKAANTGASWSGNACTLNGVTFTIQTDAGGNVTGINVNGTASGDAPSLYLAKNVALANGSYTLNGCPSNGSLQSYGIFADYSSGGNVPDYGTGGSLIISGITLNIRVRIANGYSASNILFKPMIRLSSVSDATFAPYSNICPISGWTGANVSVFDVNVWDEVWENGIYSPTTGEPLSDNNYIRSKNKISVISDTEYYVKKPSSAGFRVLYYDNSDAFISSETVADSWAGKAVTIPSNAKYVRIYCGTSTYNHDISINYPSTDTAYHAYKGNVYPITFPTSAGTVYGGALDVTNGVLTVDRGYADLGDRTWTYESGANPSLNYFECGLNPLVKNGTTNLICSKYPIGNVSYASGDDHAIMATASANHVRVRDTSYTDAATFKTAMSGVQLVYELATPVTYQLTPTEVTTLLRNNNIFADTGDIAELTYRADLKTYIDEKLA